LALSTESFFAREGNTQQAIDSPIIILMSNNLGNVEIFSLVIARIEIVLSEADLDFIR